MFALGRWCYRAAASHDPPKTYHSPTTTHAPHACPHSSQVAQEDPLCGEGLAAQISRPFIEEGRVAAEAESWAL